jgi:hypothetical protein
LIEHCSSTSGAAGPGICLALCQTDAECPLGETCWFEACVTPLPSPDAPTSAENPDASDYFAVDTGVEFSQPVSLPDPDLSIDGSSSELLGEWLGIGEVVSFYFASAGSPASMRLVISESAGQVVGQFYWEYGLVDGATFPGPFAAATNPDVGYPTEVDPEHYGDLRWPNPRVPYRIFDGALAAGRFTFWTSTIDLWSDWCSMQTAYPRDIDGKRVYRCIAESANESNTEPGKFKLCKSAGGLPCPTDNPQGPLCGVAYCECSSSSCHADLRAGTIIADLQFDGTTMSGVVTVGPDAMVMEFTKGAP